MKDMKDINIIRSMNAAPDMDLENRILRNVVVATEQLASDGMMILSNGIDLTDFKANPTITAKHGLARTDKSTSIATALEIGPVDRTLVSAVQFADTELGREYAYLYGLNPKKEVYMRAWSLEGPVVSAEAWSFDQAKNYLGRDWNETQAAILRKKTDKIKVVKRMLMKTFSAVEVGADRGALTRAYSEGVGIAGELVARMELGEAAGQIADLKSQIEELKSTMETTFFRMELERITKDTQALGRDGAAAAARGDSAGLLEELRALTELVKQK